MSACVKSRPAHYGTGLLETEISPSGDLIRWIRRLGPQAPSLFSTIATPASLSTTATPSTATGPARAPAGRPSTEVRLVAGTGSNRRRDYLVRGSDSAARLLSVGQTTGLSETLQGLGSSLRELHRQGLPVQLTPHRGMHRLGCWLTGRSRRVWAAQAAGELRDGLGEGRWTRLVDGWRDTTTDRDVVLVHGAPGLGGLVPAADGGGADLLTGEDLGAAPWYVDVGWTLGELAEIRWRAGASTDWPDLAGSLALGYGREPDERCADWAVLRIAMHLHDYVAYVRPDPAEVRRYLGLLTLLLDR
ncbi:phosphopantothenoylcysteine decarboxylase/phosphopantothenate--cysteine ligase [Nakamurella sp. UYEF19]|uniref:hypothetical protein n=1 Tax=Nakamurella sp. UYEF19 TaxID=1756392 RepID=UPI0033989514